MQLTGFTIFLCTDFQGTVIKLDVSLFILQGSLQYLQIFLCLINPSNTSHQKIDRKEHFTELLLFISMLLSKYKDMQTTEAENMKSTQSMNPQGSYTYTLKVKSIAEPTSISILGLDHTYWRFSKFTFTKLKIIYRLLKLKRSSTIVQDLDRAVISMISTMLFRICW